MELMQQVKGNYSDKREEEAEITSITREPESSRTGHELGLHQLELMELWLGRNKEEGNLRQGGGGGVAQHQHQQQQHHDGEGNCLSVVEKEHMFDKVVTPSDVGKLNRLVIPKQHAEKYFPLDSSSNEKGLLLNFEDRNGKEWRFRYSYWNSSQSYVMTKGWSRFVKEKKLDAGDIVSFQRGLGDLHRHMLYIDCGRRSSHAHAHAPDPPLFLPSIRWYSLPRYHLNHNNYLAAAHHNNYGNRNPGSGSLYCLNSTGGVNQNFQGRFPVIIDSVPVNVAHFHGHGGINTASTAAATTTTGNGKRLRLFGVNMECPSSAQDSKAFSSASSTHLTVANSLSSPSSSLHHRFRVPHQDPLSSTPRFGNHKGAGTASSLQFNLDPSSQ